MSAINDEILDVTDTIKTTNLGPRLKVTSEPDNGRILRKLWIDGKVVTDTGFEEMAQFCYILYQIADRIPPAGTRVAMLGLGFGVMSVILTGLRDWTRFDVYEKEQAIINKNSQWHPDHASKVRCIQGDYRTTLTGTYDVIIWDAAPDNPNKPLIESHLSAQGIALYFGDPNNAP